MSIVLSLMAAAFLLGAIVYVLHQNQQKEKAESVERLDPLPPLEPSLVNHVKADSDDDKQFESKPATLPDNTAAPDVPVTIATKAAASVKSWQEQCKNQRDQHQYDAALQICSEHFPQHNAFKQACLVLRAKLRNSQNQDETEKQRILRELYRHAAAAAFFHEKHAALPAPMRATQLKRLEQSQWDELIDDYQQVGYQHLTLLTATDCKLLIQAYGEPAKHEHMRELNSQIWQRLNANNA